MNAADLFLGNAQRLAHKPAFFHADGVVTHGEFAALAARSGNALTALPASPGHTVGVLMHDTPLAAAIIVGAMRAGLVPVPMNLRFASSDYLYIAQDCAAQAVIADPEFIHLLGEVRSAGIRVIGSAEFALAVDAAAAGGSSAAVTEDTPALRLYSSGTTGRPKGVIHSHRNVALSGTLLREAVGAGEGSVVFSTSKFFFAYGLENTLLAPLAMGGASILIAAWPDADLVAELCARHRPYCLLTMPTLYRRLLQLPDERFAPLRGISRFYTGGERLPDTLAQQWHAASGQELHVGYGLTETLSNVSATFPGRNRVGGCIGELLAGVECRLLERDRSDGPEVEPGEPGVLWVKHPSLALGYSDAGKTAEVFRNGWLCTSDLCSRDADGFLYHHGRVDELIKVAGQWVKPLEVEETVLADAQVREAACVVVPDGDGLERLALFIVPITPGVGLNAARSRCAQELASHSRPKWIREIDELPRTGTGKIQRFKLREALLEELRVKA